MTRKRDEALRKLAVDITPRDAKILLESLRLKVDTQWITHFDEKVWLGPSFNAEGKMIGITECCEVSDPCERHKKIAEQLVKK
jgi:hypothetical protein